MILLNKKKSYFKAILLFGLVGILSGNRVVGVYYTKEGLEQAKNETQKNIESLEKRIIKYILC